MRPKNFEDYMYSRQSYFKVRVLIGYIYLTHRQCKYFCQYPLKIQYKMGDQDLNLEDSSSSKPSLPYPPIPTYSSKVTSVIFAIFALF